MAGSAVAVAVAVARAGFAVSFAIVGYAFVRVAGWRAAMPGKVAHLAPCNIGVGIAGCKGHGASILCCIAA
jgi:hypothetical protein